MIEREDLVVVRVYPTLDAGIQNRVIWGPFEAGWKGELARRTSESDSSFLSLMGSHDTCVISFSAPPNTDFVLGLSRDRDARNFKVCMMYDQLDVCTMHNDF